LEKFNEHAFRVKFRAFFAVLGFLFAMGFVFVAVLSEEAQGSKFTGTILGFMTGTLVTLIFTYYFGSSESPGQTPTEQTPKVEPEPEPELTNYGARPVAGTGSTITHEMEDEENEI